MVFKILCKGKRNMYFRDKNFRQGKVLILSSLIFNVANSALPEEIIKIQQQRLIQEEQRQIQLQRQNLAKNPQKPLSTQDLETKIEGGLILGESPCFKIQKIILVDEKGRTAKKFSSALSYAKRKSNFNSDICIGQKSISRIVALIQNKIIDKGYTTTQVGLMPQDLNTGILKITVIAGKVGKINYPNGLNNEIPLSKGDIFNLRDLETGLENLQRIPSSKVEMKITPSDIENSSDIVLNYEKNKIPLRFSLNLDDSGSRSTGKYLGGASVAVDNPLKLSDIFYASYTHSLGGKKDKFFNELNEKTDSKTHNYNLHYSFPIHTWQVGVNHSKYNYHQAIAGYAENYDYNGESKISDISLSKNIYRNSHRKIDAKVKLWQRKSKNFIDDAELEIQRKNTAGWAVDLNHREYINDAILNVNVGYKRGTGIFNAQRAIEEEFDEGTSRMKVISADAGVYIPFSIKNQKFGFDSNIHSQWNKTPLLTQDKISIGGRNTVRGFDGEVSLSAERGFYSQNNLSYQIKDNHQVYLGYDIGRVSGESKDYLIGQTLAGTALGIKGSLKAGGNLRYDLFLAKPIINPKNYPTHKNVISFGFNYNF